MKKYQVVWKGPVNLASGLGIASREYVRALRRQGVSTSIQGAAYSLPKNRRILVYHHAPHTLNISRERRIFGRIILNTVWETTRIPRRWIRPINQADAVCVPSSQNKQAMRASGIRTPVFIVPHGVHAHFFTPRLKRKILNANRFIFISIFGFQHRKNPEALLEAYWKEFSAQDRVLLIIKTKGYAPYENAQWIRNRIQAYKARLNIRKETAPIKVIAGQLNRHSLRTIYSIGDAFVLPTRGEGVGLPFLEAMSSGLPVIATGWGGQMDFLSSQNSFLVQYRLKPPEAGMKRQSSISRQFRSLFSEKGQLWAEADVGSLRRQMRIAFQNPQLCIKKGRRARQDALRWSWSRGGASLKRAIENVIRIRK